MIKPKYSFKDERKEHLIYLTDGTYGGTMMEVKYDGEARHPDVLHHGGHGHGGGIGGEIGGGLELLDVIFNFILMGNLSYGMFSKLVYALACLNESFI